MSAQYDNSNRGALFKAREKKGENSPDYTGKLNVGGKDYDLSAWIKTSKAGEKYMSLSVREPLKTTFRPRGYSKDNNPEARQPPAFNDELPDFDSSVPF